MHWDNYIEVDLNERMKKRARKSLEDTVELCPVITKIVKEEGN